MSVCCRRPLPGCVCVPRAVLSVATAQAERGQLTQGHSADSPRRADLSNGLLPTVTCELVTCWKCRLQAAVERRPGVGLRWQAGLRARQPRSAVRLVPRRRATSAANGRWDLGRAEHRHPPSRAPGEGGKARRLPYCTAVIHMLSLVGRFDFTSRTVLTSITI